MSAHGVAGGTVGLDAVAPLPRPHPLLATPRGVLRMRSDAALAERFRAGDQEAFAVLYERHRASVLAVCIGVLGSRHDAEDAAQDAFASLAIALRTSPPRDMRAWLARVARNAAIDVIRRRRAVTPADENLERPGPASTEVRAEFASVLAGLRELPESQRTALLMRELGGHSYQEIGALLELDEAAVRGLIARGRIGLRAHREATEMPCAAAREALATEPDGRHRDRTVRRHLRSCTSCKAYGHGLRQDARSLRAVVPAPLGVASGGVIFGGFAAKTILTGGVLSQVSAACAVSVCAVGGIALLDPHVLGHHAVRHATAAPALVRTHAAGAGAIPTTTTAPPAPRAVTRGATAGAATSGARHRSASPSQGSSAVRPAPAHPTSIVSSAPVELTHRFQLPGSQTTSPTPGTAPATGATPTSPAGAPPRPVSVAPTRWGGSTSTSGGWQNRPPTLGSGSGSPTGFGSGGTGWGTGTPTSGDPSSGTGTTGTGTTPGTGGQDPRGAGQSGGTSSPSWPVWPLGF